MKKQLAIPTVLTVALLAACSSKTEPSEENFAAAITEYLNQKGDLCLYQDWPVDLYESELRMQETTPASKAGQMAALEAVGLAKAEDTVIGNSKIKRYTLTEAARPFVREEQADRGGMRGKTTEKDNLCWGKMALEKVVKWEGPIKLGDYQEAGITYTYKINAADWARQPKVQASFSVIQVLLGRAGTPSRHSVKLTSEGWEANGLD